MSEDTATQTQDDSSTQTDSSAENNQTQTNTEDTVPKSELQKVLDEMHKYKKTAKEYEAKMKEREMSELKQREEWQKVAEIKEREAQEAKEEAERLKSSFVNNRMYDAIKNAALKDGIRKEALNDLELIDFSDDVAIETTNTGKMNVVGAEAAIKKLKATRPYWFGKSVGSVNTDSPETVQGSEITLDTVMKAQAKYNKSRSPEDMRSYEKVLRAYQKSQSA